MRYIIQIIFWRFCCTTSQSLIITIVDLLIHYLIGNVESIFGSLSLYPIGIISYRYEIYEICEIKISEKYKKKSSGIVQSYSLKFVITKYY